MTTEFHTGDAIWYLPPKPKHARVASVPARIVSVPVLDSGTFTIVLQGPLRGQPRGTTLAANEREIEPRNPRDTF